MKPQYALFTFLLSFFYLNQVWAKGPVSHICKGVTTVALGDDGEATVDASVFVIPDDDCCPSGTIEYGITEVGSSDFQSNIVLTCDDLGQTFVRVRSTDCLGNGQTCETTLIVQANIGNCDDPCISCCLPVIVTESMNLAVSEFTGARVFASQFAGQSFSPCGEDLTFSFSADQGDDTRDFSCDDIGLNVLDIWATDGNGVQNFAQVTLILEDFQTVCSTSVCAPQVRVRSNVVVEVQYDSSPTCIDASDFDLGCSLSSCFSTTSYTLSFSDDPTDTERCFSCVDVFQSGPVNVEIFVIDNLGNVNSMLSQVIVQANGGQCSSVIPFSPNDDVCDAINLDNVFGEDCGVTFINIDATAEPNEIAPANGGCTTQNSWCDSGAEHSVWFTFTAPEAETVTISTDGFLDTQLALWDADDCGAISSGDATLVVANDDIPNNSIGNSAIFADCLTAGKTYFLQVDGKQGQQGGFDLTLVAEGPACVLVPAPIDAQLMCGVADINTVTSTASGEWLHFTDADGGLVASVNDMGQNLGEITADLQIHYGDVRTDNSGNHYLDRNWQIVPTDQPDGPVLVRLYFGPDELDALYDASPIVNGLGDVNGTKVSGAECGDFGSLSGDFLVPKNIFDLNTTVKVCEFEIESFSAFYLHGPVGLTFTGDPGLDIEFGVYPNPTLDELSFTLPRGFGIQGTSVQILSVDGSLVMPEKAFFGTPISVAELSAGVYFVKITRGDNTVFGKRFVKM